MIEAMANGTPVVAFRCGAVPEIIDDGVTGLVVDSIEEAVVAVPRALKLSRVRVRREFERRFCADRMARDYLAVYEGQCHGRAVRRPRLQIAEAMT
jgi:glycosyltransferase involved in cell wall biosynthesis